ncbi:hypothetical protein KY330_01815 [Candidatus Woesearchaeota archaeon]|nr:hypothetical protein [Candidatus Woesearchaeota archaeon]
MKRLIQCCIAVMFVVILMSSAYAIKDEFAVSSSNSEVMVCAGSAEPVDNIIVTNTGDITSTYSVYLEGSAAKYVSINPSRFSLNPGEYQILYLFVKTSSSAIGSYDLDIGIESDFGAVSEVEKKITTRNCQNLNIIAKKWYDRIKPCVPSEFSFNIYNTGKYTEIYELKTESEWLSFSQDALIVEPGESQEFFVYAKTPCETYGNHTLMFTVSAKQSYYTATVPVHLEIEPDYAYKVTSPEVFTVCEAGDEVLGVEVENKADFVNFYDAELLNAPRWIELENEEFGLYENSKALLNISVKPKLGLEGEFPFQLYMKSRRGELELVKNITVNVKKCYELDLELSEEQGAVCIGSPRTFDLKVVNLGEETELIGLEVKGDFVNISDEVLEVDAGEKEAFNVYMNPEKEGRYEVEVSAFLKDAPTIKKTRLLNVEVLSGKACRNLKYLTGEKIQINNSRQVIEIYVQNTGALPETYNLFVEAPEFMELQQDWLELAQGEQGAIRLEVDPEEVGKGTYKLVVQAQGEHGEAYSEIFKVKIGRNIALEFIKLYLIYVIAGIGAILIITGILKLIELKRGKKLKEVKDSKNSKDKKVKK